MRHTIFHIVEKIAALLTGCASDKDVQEVERWEQEDIRRKRLLEELANPEMYGDNQRALEHFSADEAWERVEKQLNKKARRIFRWSEWYKYAAVLVLLMGTGIWYFGQETPEEVKVTVIAQDIPSGRQGARLILGDGKIVDVTPDNQFVLAEMDGTVIRKDSTGIGYCSVGKNVDTMVFNRMETLTGMEYTLTLADGTLVYLNAESCLRFPVVFRGQQRVVELTGEAYFKVAKDVVHPFVVKMNGVDVKVVGTSFNARSYTDELQVVTTLVEGQIEVNGRQIVPGHQAVFTKASQKLTVTEVDVDQYTAWQQGYFVFRNERLEDIMKTLARWYGVEYHFMDKESKNIRLGARFGRYDCMNPIIDMLKKTELVEVLQTNQCLYLSMQK